MRNAIAWSYELLEPQDQTLFRRLGVFVGGFTLDAASRVGGFSATNTLDGVERLLSQSLLTRPVEVGEARFTMLEMIREFASEQLRLAGEAGEGAERHARYFCHMAEHIEPHLSQNPGGPDIQRLASEVDNQRGALRHALEAGDPDLGLSLASCVWRFWQSTDQLPEGREWLEDLLAQPEASREARAKGLGALAGLMYWQGDFTAALARYDETLTLYRQLGDRYNEADTLFAMSLAASLNEA